MISYRSKRLYNTHKKVQVLPQFLGHRLSLRFKKGTNEKFESLNIVEQ